MRISDWSSDVCSSDLCGFSSWKDHDDYSTGYLADPRSFCIQKTLQDIAHGGDTEQNLMFAGHAAFNFKTHPFYSNNSTPTVQDLKDRILKEDCFHPLFSRASRQSRSVESLVENECVSVFRSMCSPYN